MAALTAGTQAPEVSLPTVDGSKFAWQDALKKGPVVAAFFKVSCPVCQYAFPFLERLHQAYGDKKIAIIGVSQDDAAKSKAFMSEYGVTFPVLLDDPNGYAISNAYGLTNVPTVFFIAPDGEIELSSVGWVKKDMELLNRKLAEIDKSPATPLFKPGDDVRDFRAG